jgi:formate-dependent phosphoribosylglycinamide formyltransferase (GAR transformylase)
MRKSRVLLAGVAVAGAAVTTSAFTAGNTVQSSVAGYGSATVTGATTAHINYVLDGTDKSLVDSIVFELNEDMTVPLTEGLEAWLQLENSGAPVGSAVQCTVGAFAASVTPVTCSIPDTAIATFDGVALTVAE